MFKKNELKKYIEQSIIFKYNSVVFKSCRFIKQVTGKNNKTS